jgi:hypothetical protein
MKRHSLGSSCKVAWYFMLPSMAGRRVRDASCKNSICEHSRQSTQECRSSMWAQQARKSLSPQGVQGRSLCSQTQG